MNDPRPQPIESTDDAFPFELLPLNGFLYRFNRVTGECWRMEFGVNKTPQWKLIPSVDGPA